MDFEHRHIEVFQAIMRSGSVTAAASLLGTSQPTVSRDLARMEHLLGFALFDRVRGRLRPTAPALALYEEVQRSFIGLEHLRATAKNIREATEGRLSIGCVPAFAQAFLPETCHLFHTGHPETSISITPQESPLLEEWLSGQRHDLGLLEHARTPPGCKLDDLLEADELCVLPEGHPLTERPILKPEDFAGQSFISLSSGDPYRLLLDDVFSRRGVARCLRFETQSAASVCSLVRAGLGVAIVNPLTAIEQLGHGIRIKRFAVSIPFRVTLCRPLYRPSDPLIDDFTLALKEQARLFRQTLDKVIAV